ncbi:hypothetical protein BV898_17008 [Hypsibius exemplaris]|uniref:CAS1 domain-containing protein 1 n=1 Tax=Hypsibius exemplaris TaxID=2072580 RepID=A0A9X6NE92_HYPEX|nr:hypothetical protein BV898_17008 [Hypsibius exemplaris]
MVCPCISSDSGSSSSSSGDGATQFRLKKTFLLSRKLLFWIDSDLDVTLRAQFCFLKLSSITRVHSKSSQTMKLLLNILLLFSALSSALLFGLSLHLQINGGGGQNTCMSLMKRGTLLKVPSKGSSDQSIWQPDDCDLKLYTQDDANRCMLKIKARKSRFPANIIITGDSRMRQLRDAFFYQLTGINRDWLSNRSITHVPDTYTKHSSNQMMLRDSGVRIEFNWATGLDGGQGSTGKSLDKLMRRGRLRPADLLLIGNGVWTIRECTAQNRTQDDCVVDYRNNFLALLPKLSAIGRHTTVIWVPQIQLNESNMWDRDFTNENMRMYNEAIKSGLASVPDNKVIYWNSLEMLSSALNDSLDGLHFGPTAKYYDIQMLLNLMCICDKDLIKY